MVAKVSDPLGSVAYFVNPPVVHFPQKKRHPVRTVSQNLMNNVYLMSKASVSEAQEVTVMRDLVSSSFLVNMDVGCSLLPGDSHYEMAL
jgi:hypothetical protein